MNPEAALKDEVADYAKSSSGVAPFSMQNQDGGVQ